MVRLFELISDGTKKLKSSNTPQLDAEVILSYILNTDRIYLYLNREKYLEDTICQKFNTLIQRRLLGEPVAYLVGVREFMGLTFLVKPGVLIPRGDTEILVEAVIKRLDGNNPSIIVDIGCGSGAIGISIAKNVKNSEVFMLDIMDIPLEVTKLNAEKNGVASKVHILKSDLLKSMKAEYENKIEVIVSNPPYIEEAIIPELMVDVKNYEPINALSGGADGLDYYKAITRSSTVFLKEDGLLAYEIGYNQAEAVINIMKTEGFYDIELTKDLGGKDRVLLGKLRKC